MKTLLHKAEQENYAVGSFSVANMEMIIGTIKAAEELKSPIILQIAEVRLKQSPLKLIGPVMVNAAKEAKIPVAVHFDHGVTIENIQEAIKLGFTSVMIDGSKLPLDENIQLTKKIVELAQASGVDTEAEIGKVGGSEDGSENIKMLYTDVKEAELFYESTKVDALAIAIGNAHGVYKGDPKLNFEILQNINECLDVPLVLHGGSGISEDDFRRCIDLGIRKINVATATFISVENAVRNLYNASTNIGYYDLHEAEIEGAYNNVKKHIKIFRCENKI
jgi:fructose-bisphosphate aldolase class II